MGVSYLFNPIAIKQAQQRSLRIQPPVNFLEKVAAHRLVERITQFNLKTQQGLVLEAHSLHLHTLLQNKNFIAATVFQSPDNNALQLHPEWLPFKEAAFDAVASCMLLQNINNIPQHLLEIRRLLKKGGFYNAVCLGGTSLHELRACLQQAEQALKNGISPRVHPMIDVKDAGMLLQKAGFTEPVTDVDTITVSYQNLYALLKDLQAMGWQNCLESRQKNFTSRALFHEAAALYQAQYPNPEGGITATFQFVYMNGWR